MTRPARLAWRLGCSMLVAGSMSIATSLLAPSPMVAGWALVACAIMGARAVEGVR